MTAIAEVPVPKVEAPSPADALRHPPLDRGEGVELLGDIDGCGYRDGACLVRRGDGQMVRLGPLMYALLESIDGQRDNHALASAMSERIRDPVRENHVVRLARKLAAQGLLAGTEHKAPPRRNPLLALRWKVLVTDPKLTRRLTTPFTFLFSPWLMWPILGCFVAVCWFVLFHKGVASATAEAFHSPGLFLLVFVLAIVSAAFHELGHAAAARYGGATPRGMGMGIYLVWPAFYTDVTDAYRLPKRDRLRVDLGGLYFNAAVAVITMAAWLLLRVDALLLLVALQVLQMVKQLSPVIRADGYHILSDATGVPDLFAHMAPTLRRILPGHRREPSALTGRARLLVTVWVLVVVPVLLSLMVGAVILLPHLVTSAWASGSHIVSAIPREAGHGQLLDVLASMVSLVALMLPVAGSVLVSQKIVRTTAYKARDWSRGRPLRRAGVVVAAAAAIAGMIWAWWPSGQYQPIRPNQPGTVDQLVKLIAAPAAAARPATTLAPARAAPLQPAPAQISPGTHLALSMIPAGGATKNHPALFVIPGKKDKPPMAIWSTSTPAPRPETGAATTDPSIGGGSTTTNPAHSTRSGQATVLPFRLPPPPGPHGTQALALGTKNGGVTYDVAYSLVTVHDGARVNESNRAYALADCHSCTTVAVSFQVVLVVGQSNVIIPTNAAEALNYNCPACTTTAIADQIVVTLKSQPSRQLLARLESALRRLNALWALGANGTSTAVASQVAAVQQAIDTDLNQSGLLANPPNPTNTTSSTNTTNNPSPATRASGGDSTTTPTGQTPPPNTTTTTTTGTTTDQTPPPTTTTATTPQTPPPTTTTSTTPGQTTGPGTTSTQTNTSP